MVGTDWEGGLYKLILHFPDDYPARPPLCTFTPPLFHPNLFDNGQVCLSIINPDGWSPSVSIKQILLAIQDLLDNPNPDDPACICALKYYVDKRSEYNKRIRQQALRNVPDC